LCTWKSDHWKKTVLSFNFKKYLRKLWSSKSQVTQLAERLEFQWTLLKELSSLHLEPLSIILHLKHMTSRLQITNPKLNPQNCFPVISYTISFLPQLREEIKEEELLSLLLPFEWNPSLWKKPIYCHSLTKIDKPMKI